MAKAPGSDANIRRPIVNFKPKFVMSDREDDAGDEGDEEGEPPSRQTPPKKKQTIDLVEVDIGGKKYKMTKEDAAEYSKNVKKRPAPSVTDEIKSMLEEYTSKIGGKKKKAAEPDDEDGDSDDINEEELFTAPKKFFKKFRESLSAEVLKAVSGAYNQDQNQRTFWADFYRSNDDLSEYDFIVRAVMSKNAAELAPMNTVDAAERLAELTREQLLGMAKKISKGKIEHDPKKKFHVEGERSSRRGQVEGDEDNDIDDDERDKKAGVPMTMGAILKARQEKRRQPLIRETEEE